MLVDDLVTTKHLFAGLLLQVEFQGTVLVTNRFSVW
jgi:hypothetical protein